jgi:carboxyl-terminal processing protease
MEFLKKNPAALIGILLVGGIIFSVGYNAGKKSVIATAVINVDNKAAGQPINLDFSPFWKVWNILNEKYVDTSATTSEPVADQEKIWGAIKGLTASFGDPYTVFFPPVEAESFAAEIRGNFEGVGMEVVIRDGALLVISPIKGSPAERAGMLAGDRIIKIDDKDTSNLTTEGAVGLIRGKAGTTVRLTVVRASRKAPFEVSIMRGVIDIPTIDTKDLGNGIFKIDLYSFTADSPNLFRRALREFIESGNGKLILDLRGNPGGYLEAAIDMASWFLPTGKVVVRESFGGNKEEQVYRSKGYDIFTDRLQFVILVDGGSASAAEIFAGALSEHGKAVLVGDKTFGKGSVQELVDVTPTTSLKVTVARWLTPNGASISETGITPQYTVKMTEVDVTAGRDPQLDKAIEILNK